MVLNELIKLEYYKKTSDKNQEILFLAALFHDIGKLISTDYDGNKITSHNHSKLGSQDFRYYAWCNGFDPEIREHIAKLILFHQKPFHWAKKMDLFDLIKLSRETSIELLLTLCEADLRGRIIKDGNSLKNTLENLELMKIMAIENHCFNQPWQFYKNTNIIDHISRQRFFKSGDFSLLTRSSYKETGSHVILLCGLPASGKDYWCKHYANGKTVLSYDEEREKMGKKFNLKQEGQVVQLIKDKIKKLLRSKEDFIINATHISETIRDKTIRLLHNYNAIVTIVILEANQQEIKKRNDKRNSSISMNSINLYALKWDVPLVNDADHVIWWKNDQPFFINHLTTPENEYLK